jgi:hypothetical protein
VGDENAKIRYSMVKTLEGYVGGVAVDVAVLQ